MKANNPKAKAAKPQEAPMYPAPSAKGFKKDPAKIDPVMISNTPRAGNMVGPERAVSIQESKKFTKSK